MPDVGQVLAEIVDRQRQAAVLLGDRPGPLQLLLDVGQLRLDLRRLRPERLLVHDALEKRVQQPILHVGQFGAALGQARPALLFRRCQVLEARLDGVAEPLLDARNRDADAVEFGHDGLLDLGLAPAHGWMVVRLGVVSALVIDVDVAAAVLELLLDPFAGHGVPADAAAQNAAR